jgi:branched-chain amino acid transport system permease protein
LAIPAGMLIGGLTERFLVRPLYGKPEINPIVAMVGLLIFIEAVVGSIWGTQKRPVVPPFSFIDFHVGTGVIALSPLSLFQIVSAVTLAIAIAVLFRFTNLGLQLRASAVAPEVSRLLGVRVSRMLTLGWMLACGVAAIAAAIVSAGFFSGLQPSGMEGPFAFGFIAAAVGGLESPSGAIVGGVALGVLESFVTDYFNANLVLPYTVLVLIIVLVVRPNGIFARQVVRRV